MRTALLAILVVVTSLLTTAPTGEQAGKVVRSSLNGEAARLTLPTGAGKPKGLVIWFHGQGGNVNDRIDGPFLSALSRDGFAVASSDFHLQSWGNEASTDDTIRLIKWAEGQVDVPVSLWVSGSMGGAISLNALNHGAAAPACWYGVKPAISLNHMEAVPTGTRYISLAFDGTVPDDRNPVQNFDSLPSDVRYRVVASPGDHWVPIDQNGGALVSSLDKRGVEVSYLAATGEHEDPSHWNAADLVDFADSCVGDASRSASD